MKIAKRKRIKRNCVVVGYNEKTGERNIWLNGSIAADQIGCSKVFIYKVLNKEEHYLTAKGWRLDWLDMDELAVKGKEWKI